MSLSTEYGILGTEFTPFDDTQQVVFIPTNSDTGGIDLRSIAQLRQGVEIRTNKDRFRGMQPKVWSGNLKHYVNTLTIGQPRSFTEFENDKKFIDITDFNPVTYLQNGNQFQSTFMFNEGPQQQEEASLEPITIPFRKKTNEGPFYAHRIAASISDGNDFDTVYKHANRTTNLIDYQDPSQQRYFLDQGAEYVGDGTIENKIIKQGYVFSGIRLITPFNDTSDDDIIDQFIVNDQNMSYVLKQLNYNLDNDLRNPRTRSANSGFFIYGGDSAKYGTDSVTFAGTSRGSRYFR